MTAGGEPSRDDIIAKAREMYGVEDVLIWDDAPIRESFGNDGVWVQAWLFVQYEKADEEDKP